MVGIIKPSRKCHTFLNITYFLVWIQNFNTVAILLHWIKNQVVSWAAFKQARFKSSIHPKMDAHMFHKGTVLHHVQFLMKCNQSNLIVLKNEH